MFTGSFVLVITPTCCTAFPCPTLESVHGPIEKKTGVQRPIETDLVSWDLGPRYSRLHVEVLHSGTPQGVQDLLLGVLVGSRGAVLGPGLTLLLQSGEKR